MCVKNRGSSIDLDLRRVYRVIDDNEAERRGLIRVVDESGEDYHYPAGYFVPLELPRSALRLFRSRSA